MKEMSVFIHGFYNHHCVRNLKKAKSLYKRALKRSECPTSSFTMLLSVYLTLYSGDPSLLK